MQRVNQCLRDACVPGECNTNFIDCGRGNEDERFGKNPLWNQWTNNTNASACFGEDGFSYGIYILSVNLTTKSDLTTRYIYSLFWGFQVSSSIRSFSILSLECAVISYVHEHGLSLIVDAIIDTSCVMMDGHPNMV